MDTWIPDGINSYQFIFLRKRIDSKIIAEEKSSILLITNTEKE